MQASLCEVVKHGSEGCNKWSASCRAWNCNRGVFQHQHLERVSTKAYGYQPEKWVFALWTKLQMSVLEGSSGHPALTAVAVENEIFKANGGVTAAYKAKFRNLHFNMKDEKNPDLRRKVCTLLSMPRPCTTVSLCPHNCMF